VAGRNEPHIALSEQYIQVVEIQTLIVGDPNRLDLGTRCLAHHLPRYQVGVVLHFAYHDDIARPQVSPTPRRADEVDRFGRGSREDDLVGTSSAQEAGYLAACGFVPPGGTDR
jgi:hypothetical protein